MSFVSISLKVSYFDSLVSLSGHYPGFVPSHGTGKDSDCMKLIPQRNSLSFYVQGLRQP